MVTFLKKINISRPQSLMVTSYHESLRFSKTANSLVTFWSNRKLSGNHDFGWFSMSLMASKSAGNHQKSGVPCVQVWYPKLLVQESMISRLSNAVTTIVIKVNIILPKTGGTKWCARNKLFLLNRDLHATNVLESTSAGIHDHANHPAHFMAHAPKMSRCKQTQFN